MIWQPIETAPKDGTWILVWGGKTDENMEWWDEKDRNRPVTARWCSESGRRSGYWRFASYDGGYLGDFVEDPTHWQPLPELPKQADD
jgi:hypothetical protein